MRLFAALIGWTLFLTTSPAVAQDVNIGWNLAADDSMQGIHQDVLESSLGVGGSVGNRRSPRALAPLSPARATSNASFAYTSTPALARQAVDGYIARASRTEPRGAKMVAAILQRHDYRAIYRNILAGTGLRENDAADAAAMYTALGWVIANGETSDPSPAAFRALRAQIAGRAGSNPSFSPGRRGQLAEEMKLLVVTLHGGLQGAAREGKSREYANGVAAMFRRANIDLRALRMTAQGFITK